MDDKTIMMTILNNIKGTCDLMMHGTIESSTPNVHNAFSSSLQDYVSMQNEIYNKMSQKGWYQMTLADASQIMQTKQKFQQK